jgi:RNA polymerase sigma-70 factor, ECF subfamily
VSEREQEWAGLMHSALAGDRAAYEALLRAIAVAIRPLVRRGLLRAGRAAAEAEDIVQDVLLAVHLKRHTWNPSEPVSPWVYAIARYKLVDALRKRGSRQHVSIDAYAESLPAEPADSFPASDVERALAHLPSGQRQVVRTVAIEGASITDAAARLNMTPGAVRVALHRGISTLVKVCG